MFWIHFSALRMASSHEKPLEPKKISRREKEKKTAKSKIWDRNKQKQKHLLPWKLQRKSNINF